MSQLTHITSLAIHHKSAAAWITNQLETSGLIVLPSFDLQAARSAHVQCACPHHGTENCDCQIKVLLVYDGDSGPISLILHSQDGTSLISMVANPLGTRNETLEEKIIHILGNPHLKNSH